MIDWVRKITEKRAGGVKVENDTETRHRLGVDKERDAADDYHLAYRDDRFVCRTQIK